LVCSKRKIILAFGGPQITASSSTDDRIVGRSRKRSLLWILAEVHSPPHQIERHISDTTGECILPFGKSCTPHRSNDNAGKPTSNGKQPGQTSQCARIQKPARKAVVPMATSSHSIP
jgi:hypothetical protein